MDKLLGAIMALYNLEVIFMEREGLEFSIEEGRVSRDDPWAVAALASNDDVILDVALKAFLSDVKEGLYG